MYFFVNSHNLHMVMLKVLILKLFNMFIFFWFFLKRRWNLFCDLLQIKTSVLAIYKSIVSLRSVALMQEAYRFESFCVLHTFKTLCFMICSFGVLVLELGPKILKWDMKQLKIVTIAPTLLCNYESRCIRALCGENKCSV